MIPIYAGDHLPEALAKLQSISMVSDPGLASRVQEVIALVQSQKDQGLKALAQRFGDSVPESFELSPEAIEAAIQRVSPENKAVIEAAAQNIRTFAQALMNTLQPVQVTQPGFTVGLDLRPVERVGCYVPGGRYPLPSTALMTAITAQVAGVPHICITSPVLKDEVVYAGTLAGVRTFYQVGGAQAVAALAFGTESIAPVDMVVGPGNAYVTEAKRQLQGVIGIDMLAGPSEVVVIADGQANPGWVALDLLAQAEHDPNARTYLLTNDASLAKAVAQEVEKAFTSMALSEDVTTALKASGLFVLPSLQACVEVSNTLAPEHLELHVRDIDTWWPKLTHYGAVFLGDFASVPFGDYMAGPNHTLPTGRSARFSGTLSPLTFLRPQSWIRPTTQAQDLAQRTAQFAAIEGLRCHEAAALARIAP